MFTAGSYRLFCAFDAGRMVGMITLRGGQHISLLFVDENYQHRGIGAALIQAAGQFVCGRSGCRLTVNAAPDAVGFYHKVGFLIRIPSGLPTGSGMCRWNSFCNKAVGEDGHQ